MTDYPRDKYYRDPAYYALVNAIEQIICRAEFSPSEIREAAVLACINYEMHTIRFNRVSINAGSEQEKALSCLHEWATGKQR